MTPLPAKLPRMLPTTTTIMPPCCPSSRPRRNDDDVAAMPPPAPKLPVNFSVDSMDKFLVSYHCKGKQDVADMVFHVNGVLRNTNYHESIAAD
jgi:hypothetical protein